jgi:hypothetical protein
MSLRLLQLRRDDGTRCVVASESDGTGRCVAGVTSTYQLAQLALSSNRTLAGAVQATITGDNIDLSEALAQGLLLAPIDHVDSAHLHLSGTGLTHLGSADSRDKMHKAATGGAITDSMRMFNMGMEGGKPAGNSPGVQPEWFYKGDGTSVCGPEMPLRSPEFALDGSEEPEIAGIYLIDQAGSPRRLGYCLANEFSDHITERGNYLWLAHSKLRPAALGPELLTGKLPDDIQGTSRIVREGRTIWEKPFLTGEANMSHSLANLEAHHFKYALFLRPGDVHVHFFGTATLSFADGIQTRAGDVFEIEAPPFRLPLRNRLERTPQSVVQVRAL